ncbi:MAG: hypothetical protein ACKO96_33840 [Flammeovirgaceae bacterium]
MFSLDNSNDISQIFAKQVFSEYNADDKNRKFCLFELLKQFSKLRKAKAFAPLSTQTLYEIVT